jgi:hypothetical protein
MTEDVGENCVDAHHKSMPRSPIIETVAAGMKGSHGFLQKLFSRQPSTSALRTLDAEDEIKYTPLADRSQLTYNDLKVLPCQYIRPLRNRLEPRQENIQKSHRRPGADSAIPILRKKTEPARCARNELCPDTAVKSNKGDPAVMDSIEIRGRRLRKEIALAATADVSYFQEWSYYIKCYSEVRS